MFFNQTEIFTINWDASNISIIWELSKITFFLTLKFDNDILDAIASHEIIHVPGHL